MCSVCFASCFLSSLIATYDPASPNKAAEAGTAATSQAQLLAESGVPGVSFRPETSAIGNSEAREYAVRACLSVGNGALTLTGV